MLDAPELAKRLRAAMDLREPKILSVYLAEQCGVTKQAVHGWRKHGRIAKKHLQAISRVTGRPLEFFLEPERGESRETRAAWRIASAFAKALVVLVLVIPPSPADAGFNNKRIVSTDLFFVRLINELNTHCRRFLRRVRDFLLIPPIFRTAG